MIDFHTYPVMIKEIYENDDELYKVVKNVFGFGFPPQPLDLFFMEMREAGVEKAVLLPLDCSKRHNCEIVSNEIITELMNKYSYFIGFASVDPTMENACLKLEEAIINLGLKGLNLDPAIQGFFIDDKTNAYPIYELCQSLKIPIIIHCGLNWSPSALVKYSRPYMLDEVALNFPDLSIVISHFGWPWVDEALMIAIKRPNVYLDTAILYSGTPSETYKKIFESHIGLEVLERSLRTKILFGSNYPRIDMRRSVRGINNLCLSNEFKEMVFNDNAKTLLGFKE